jgi:TolB-like protein/Tfp pilus assembly protein PilF
MASDIIQFEDLELDLSRYELRRSGRALRLERIPMDLLVLLVQQRGRLVTRNEIIQGIWGNDVFVDTDNSINTAIRKIRQVLKDDPAKPRFLETVSGKGYRFVSTTHARLAATETGPAVERVMLVVLPFDNLSNDPQQEYFSDGLTEETITHLGQLSPEKLGVIARTSSMSYKRTNKTAAQIGAELGVDYLLEGSVRREGDQVRVSAQLIRVSDQVHVWAHSYDRELRSILTLQAELAMAIAQQVRLRLTPEEKLQLRRPRQEDPAVLDDYLRGRYHWAKRRYPDICKAIDYFNAVLQRDPEHTRAMVGLADCHIILPITSDVPSFSAFPKAKAALEKALSIDDKLAEVHTSCATLKFWFEWDWAGAERSYRHAIQLNPNYSVAHLYYAHSLSNQGKHEEALKEILLARRLDPLSPIMSTLYAEFLYHARRYEESRAEFIKALELDPYLWVAHICLGKLYERTGHYSTAIAELDKAREYSGGNTEALSMLVYVSSLAGNKGGAKDAMKELIDTEKRRYVPPYNLAVAHLGLGDKDETYKWLEKAYEDRDVHLTFLLDPKWDCLTCEERFQDLLRRVGLSGR